MKKQKMTIQMLIIICISQLFLYAQISWNEIEVLGDLPYPRDWSTGIYDAQNDKMIVFGGWSGVPYNSLNDVWSFDPTLNSWTKLFPTGGPPPTRAAHVAVYDSLRHRMVVFAGSNWWQTWRNDTWALDLTTNTWAQLSTTGGPPVNRYAHSGIYDSFRDRLIIFGGRCGSVSNNWYGNDTWALDFTTLEWVQLNTTNNPTPRECTSGIYDKENDRMIIFGGNNSSTQFSDSWELNLSTGEWTYLGDFENTVTHHIAVYSQVPEMMIALVGWTLYEHGQAAIFSTLDNTWLDIPIIGTKPSPRGRGAAVWDSQRRRALLFGGGVSLTENYNDTWELTFPGTSILSVAPNNVPNTGTSEVTIWGIGFEPGADVRITRTGYQDITPIDTLNINSNKIVATFNFYGRQLGDWDVKVTNPGGEPMIMQNGITIAEEFVNLWADVISRNQFRLGREQSIIIRYGNTGNVGAYGVPIHISGIPAGSTIELGFEIIPPLQPAGGDTINWSEIPLYFESNGEIIIPLIIPSIPPGHTGEFLIKTKIFTAGSFQVNAEVYTPHFQSSVPPESIPITIDQLECAKAIITGVTGLVPGLGCLQTIWDQELILIGDLWFGSEIFSGTHFWYKVLKSCADAGGIWTKVIFIVSTMETFSSVYNECREAFAQMSSTSHPVSVVGSWDPNEKVGPTGFSISNAISINHGLQYIVFFENVDSATAAAQEVEILDTLDTNLDWNSFQFSALQIADTLISINDSTQTYSNVIPWNDTTEVQITGSFNNSTGVIRWYMRGTDIGTGELADFLYPNQSPPEGEGWVSFSVNPKSNLVTGDQIRNKAGIIFDVNPPVITNEVFNTIDAAAPTSEVYSVTDTSSQGSFELHWTGEDDFNGSQIRNYSIYAADNGGPYNHWLTQVSDTTSVFPGEGNHLYWFYSIAKDSVGNLEGQPVDQDLSVWNAGYDFSSPGWQMAAISNYPADDSLHTLFPRAINAYAYSSTEKRYIFAENLSPKDGYWISMPEITYDYIAGIPLDEYTGHYQPGWHLIGSIVHEIDFSDPIDNPDSAVIKAYGWDATAKMYFIADSLLPNRAYWIAVVEECDLMLSLRDTLTNVPVVQNLQAKIESFYQTYGAVPSPPPFPTGLEEEKNIPSTFSLSQNYPNPFNPVTTIRYQVPKIEKVTIEVYNILGERVKTLVNELLEPGYYEVKWRSNNDYNNQVASGVYIYRMRAGDFVSVKKMIVLK